MTKENAAAPVSTSATQASGDVGCGRGRGQATPKARRRRPDRCAAGDGSGRRRASPAIEPMLSMVDIRP